MVFVLSNDRQPLDPCHPARARQLLKKGKAAVFRRFPFTIILKYRSAAESQTHVHRLKLDPGSKTTGIAVVREADGQVAWAAVNSTRWALYQALVALELPVEAGTGGRTKFNRTRLGLSKAHWTDAACVGASTPDTLDVRDVRPLLIRATGHGARQMCRMNKYGFPASKPKQARTVYGIRTGDIVRAVVPSGKKLGTYVGRVAVRASGSFNVVTANGMVQGISHRYCRLAHRSDGYRYASSLTDQPPLSEEQPMQACAKVG